jgi:hypothetical protein
VLLKGGMGNFLYFPQDGRLGLWSVSVGLAELSARRPS